MLLRVLDMCAVIVLVMLVRGVRSEALGTLEAILPSYLLENVEDLVRTASTACEILPLELFFSRQSRAELPLDVVEYTRSGVRSLRARDVPRELRAGTGAGTAPLVLYVPGWWNTPTDEAARALAAALLHHHPALLVLDTRRAFARGYLSAAARVDAVAHLLYSFIRNLNDVGISPATIHIVGFSLGAHVAGMTGKLVQKGLKTKLERITALDPAKPCFTRSKYRLQRSDAKFVQVIHSSAGVLGLEEPVGHVDVYVNGVAVTQPECKHRSISFECDHNQAWRVFAASASAARGMRARRCAGWQEVLAGACSGPPAPLGYPCSDSARGMFLYKSGS